MKRGFTYHALPSALLYALGSRLYALSRQGRGEDLSFVFKGPTCIPIPHVTSLSVGTIAHPSLMLGSMEGHQLMLRPLASSLLAPWLLPGCTH